MSEIEESNFSSNNDFFVSLFDSWLQNYFAESGKAGFSMRLQYFQTRERYSKEFMVVSLTIFSIVSGLIIGSKGILEEIVDKNILLLILIVFFIQVNIVFISVLVTLKNLKNIKSIMEFHIGYAEKMTSRLLPSISVSMSANSLPTGNSIIQLITNFWTIYKPNVDEYVKKIVDGEEVIRKFENRQYRLLVSNIICFIAIIIFIILTYMLKE